MGYDFIGEYEIIRASSELLKVPSKKFTVVAWRAAISKKLTATTEEAIASLDKLCFTPPKID